MLKSGGHSVSKVCEVLRIARSSYYRKKSREKIDLAQNRAITQRDEKNEELLRMIIEIKMHHPAWGYRRIRAFIKLKHLIPVSYNRVYRVMKANGLLLDVKRYKAKRRIQYSKPKPDRPNQWWGTDMTKFYVNSVGWFYIVVIIDWYSKKILGHKLSIRSKADDWIEALNMAVQNNCPLGAREYNLNLMSDNGSQPTSIKYQTAIDLLKINHVTTSYSNPKGNADTERFMRTFKEEVVYPNEFDTFEEAKEAVNNFIRFYNQDYPHSALGYLSPIEFEQQLTYKNAA